MIEYESEYENICKPFALGLTLVPGLWKIYEAINICKAFRGEINVVSNKLNNEKLVEHIRNSDTCNRK